MKINLPLSYSLDKMIDIKAEKKQFGFCSIVSDDILYYLIYKKKLSPKKFNQENFEIKYSLSVTDLNQTGVAGQYFLIVGKSQFFILKTFYQGIYETIVNPFYFEEKKAFVKSKREQNELLKMKQYLQLGYLYQERVQLSYVLLQNEDKTNLNFKLLEQGPQNLSNFSFSIRDFNTKNLHPEIAYYFEKIKKIYKNFLLFSQAKLNELNYYLDRIFNFIQNNSLGQTVEYKKTKKI